MRKFFARVKQHFSGKRAGIAAAVMAVTALGCSSLASAEGEPASGTEYKPLTE